MTHNFFTACTLFLCIPLFLFSCDEGSAPTDLNTPVSYIEKLEISPQIINFSQENDGFRDTTFNLTIRATLNGTAPVNPVLILTEESGCVSETLTETEMNPEGNSGVFTAEFSYTTSTANSTELLARAFIYDRQGEGNYASGTIKVNGFSNIRPEILSVNNPATIQRPSSGSVLAKFEAKVTDREGYSNLQGVYIRVINSENSKDVEGSPFLMADDGSTYEDAAACDSLFTWSQSVTPTTNNPNRDFNIEYFAVDKGGLHSDTVRTTFSIREQ